MFSSKYIKPRDQNKSWTQIVIVFITCIPVFVCGAFLSWTSPSIIKLMSNDSHIPMTFEETSYFAIINPISIIIFSPLNGFLLGAMGRKRHMLLVFLPQFASWMLIAFSVNAIMLYASKAIGGFADSLMLITIPVYVGEVTEKRMRGFLCCISTIYFFLGQIVMNAVGYYFTIQTAAFIICSFTVLHIILFVWMPESPYWLIEKDRLEEAKQVLQILRWRSNVDEEFNELEQAVKRQISEKGSYKDVFASKTNRRAFLVASMVRLTQQFSGINAYMIYLQYIFKEAGGEIPSHMSSIICMSLLSLGAIVGSRLVDRVGRKPLLQISCYGAIITLICETVYFGVREKVDTSVVGWLPLAIMVAYIALYSVGLCIIPMILTGELFSSSIKLKAVVLMVVLYATGMLISAKVFQSLADNVSMWAPFLFFAVSTIFFTIIDSFIVTETKNKTLEEIQQDLLRATS